MTKYTPSQEEGMVKESVEVLGSGLQSRDTEFVQNQVSRYVYEALNEPDKIRILILHSTKGRIECSLRQANISKGRYQALSYVWGKPEQHFRAVVLDENGDELGYIPLTENLQAALCDLREAKGVTSKKFWIDQICIDQQGDEKNHQVALMGEIYRNAARVITYLGPSFVDKDEEKRGLALLHQVYEHFSADYGRIYEANGMRRAWEMRSTFPVVNLPAKLQQETPNPDFNKCVLQGWRWLIRAAYGTWTTRLWLVQEQLLNKNIIMLHGQSLLSWEALISIVLLFSLDLLPSDYLLHYIPKEFLDFAGKLTGINDSLYMLWHIRGKQRINGRRILQRGLLDNMSYFQSLGCWNPRDRIFAVLAISSDAAELNIAADYSAPTPRVFTDLSAKVLLNHPDLTPLALASCWRNSNASP